VTAEIRNEGLEVKDSKMQSSIQYL